MKCLDEYFSKTLNQTFTYDFLKQEYINGKSLRAIELEYGISRASLSRHLKQDGVVITGNNPNQLQRYQFYCDENFFEKIDNEDKAYCLGFFMADGSFTANGIKFDQCISDICILEYIKKVMKAEQEIKIYDEKETYDSRTEKTYISQKMCRLNLSRIKLKEDLICLGILHQKTYNFNNLKVPTEFWNDFMRGFLDGDGNISKNDQHRVFSIRYTIKNKQFVDFIVNNSKPFYDFNICLDTLKNCYYISIQSKKEAQKFKDYVYHKDFHFCLTRKLDVLNEILGN